jgi:hypothetical protein
MHLIRRWFAALRLALRPARRDRTEGRAPAEHGGGLRPGSLEALPLRLWIP